MSEYEQLVAAAEDTDAPSFRRRMAIAELSRRPEPDVAPQLCKMLDEPDRYLRREIVSGLARLDSPAAIPGLLQALQDSDDAIRREAVETLGKVGDLRVVESLRPLADDASYSIRNAAVRAVEQIESRSSAASPSPEPPASGEPQTQAAVASAEPAAQPDLDREPAPERDPEPPPDFSAATAESAVEEPPVVEASVVEPLDAEPFEPGPPEPEPLTAERVTASGRSSGAAADLTYPSHSTAPRAASAVGPPAASLPQESPPTAIDWRRANRMRQFFGDALPTIRSAYETVLQQQRELHRRTADYRKIFEQLRQTQAVEKEPLERCTAAIESSENEVQELSTKAARIERKRTHLVRELNSAAYLISTLFAADKKREDQQQAERWQTELEHLYAKKGEAAERLQQARSEYERHVQPLGELEEELETLQRQRDEALQQLGAAHAAVNALVLDVLLPLSTDELESRLRQLSRSASRPQSLERIRPWLIRSIAEWQRRSAASEQVEAGFQQVIDRLDQAGQDLTETLAEGFLVTEATKQAVVRLQGEVSFEEQRSAFRGYSGASGTAAGTGRGTASYSIEEVAWQAPGDLPEQVAAFAAAWQAAGGAAAERQLNRSLAECAEQAVDDWVYLIRAELESDLPELSE